MASVQPGRLLPLLSRIRLGDQQAARDLVAEYEPEVRRAVRFRLRDRRLRAVCDSMDIVQSVLAGFFERVRSGLEWIESPDDLVRFLVRVARNKVVDLHNHSFAARRDRRQTQSLGDGEAAIHDGGDGPEESAMLREFLTEFPKRLSDEEQEIAALRRDGVAWAQIAERFGGTPDAQRMRFATVVRRVTREMGLDEF